MSLEHIKQLVYTKYDEIYNMLSNFRNHVLNKYSLSDDIKTNNLIIIDRKTNRKIIQIPLIVCVMNLIRILIGRTKAFTQLIYEQ